ncbi:hypothetical protein [Dictyobacter formicarum]|uniref:NUMOD4 domain-containing protein n=1 Tax=Dictyobacter formicarum TaxID=2778368 RepID=A0ABQ3VRG6_9CHLR|nr:hypothetical protein [Dictyobacter formicarum]GHO88311.1 hypothetical protein KSZ_63170 [Dictyobacter formicarum]
MMERLAGVRAINEAVWANVNGRNNGVYARMADGGIHRINRARRVRGVLQVHSLNVGRWLAPIEVYQA